MEKHTHPHTVVTASKILAVLSLNGYLMNSYAILSKLMSHHGNIQMLYTCWLSVLVGADVAIIPFSFTFIETITMLQQYIKVKGKTINGSILAVIMEMLKPVVREISDPKDQIGK